jgi:type I restriction enzyme S subunit
MGWNRKKLDTIIQFKNGKKRPNSSGTISVYGGNGILGYTDESNYKDCIVVGRVGAYCGSVYYEPFECWVSDNAIVGQPKNDTDISYAYYLLSSLQLNRRHIGTGQPLLTQSILNGIECLIPDVETQKKISGLLGSIDKKIHLNEEVNENLEQQARAIYSKMFIDNVDASWSLGVLSDIAEITMGQSPKGDTYNEEGVGIVFFQGRAEFGFRFPTRRLYTTDPKRMAQSNDILLSVRAPVGDLNVAIEPCCIGRGLGAIHSKDGHQSFVLYTMFALRQKLDMFNGEGTVFGSINRDALNSMEIVIPSVDEMDRFEDIVAPMDAAIRNNYNEICRLEAIRDTLLPRLMSGELDIANLDL